MLIAPNRLPSSHAFARVILLSLALGTLLALPSLTYAYQEPNTLIGTGCGYCHPAVWNQELGIFQTQRRATAGGDCDACHATYDQDVSTGPHGGYTTSSRKCEACHSVHQAPTPGIKLLDGATIQASCFACHDGTGGHGVYGTIAARGGEPGARHRCEVTDSIPGGSASTGGSATRIFKGTSGSLTCSDCHSPHAADVVNPFYGDRKRVRSNASPQMTNKLLKRSPTGSSASTQEYGSDWCLGCHEGRNSGGLVHNHPVDSGAGAFTYDNLAILASNDPTALTVIGSLGGVAGTASHWIPQVDPPGNRGYLMPFPRTAQQGTHKPICQQCHEDSRQVGTLSADGATGDAATAQIAQGDGVIWNGSAWVDSPTDNPKFQNFPHETTNARMLVEPGDDLCMNCHPTTTLP